MALYLLSDRAQGLGLCDDKVSCDSGHHALSAHRVPGTAQCVLDAVMHLIPHLRGEGTDAIMGQ